MLSPGMAHELIGDEVVGPITNWSGAIGPILLFLLIVWPQRGEFIEPCREWLNRRK